MDDEECLPENGTLKTYLQSLGYTDVQVKETEAASTVKFDCDSPKTPRKPHAELLDDDIVKQIQILVSTHMLFEEDVANVENVLSNFKIKKFGMLKNMFQGVFGIVIIFFGLFLYWVVGGYAFFISSSLYAYRASDYLWRKHYSQARLKKLATVLQSNFALLSKTVKFINENNKFVESSRVDSCETTFNSGFDLYNNFKTDFHKSLTDMIGILSKSTQKLVSQVPLYDYVENSKYYICNNIDLKCCESNVDLLKLYQIYLLVQSEFLQRLILSLIPNLNLSKGNKFEVLNKILTESCVSLLRIKNNLNVKFKFIFFNGIHNRANQTMENGTLLGRPKVCQSNYENEFVSNIHDVSNTFQNLLIKSRILEENIKSNKAYRDIETDLANMQTELNYCQKNISDGFILLKKATGSGRCNGVVQMNENQVETEPDSGEVQRIHVGRTDLNPSVEDEVFEAYFTEDNSGGDFTKCDDWDPEDVSRRKLEREFSKNVMTELRTRLVEKERDWKEREANITRKRYGDWKAGGETCDSMDDVGRKSDAATASPGPPPPPSPPLRDAVKEQAKRSRQVPQVRDETPSPRGNVTFDSDLPPNPFQFVNKNFLSDISRARQRILQTDTEEETNELCFGDSDSDTVSSDELLD